LGLPRGLEAVRSSPGSLSVTAQAANLFDGYLARADTRGRIEQMVE
jgi:hypothetical protein